MTPERWQCVERLYHAALERDRTSRRPFSQRPAPEMRNYAARLNRCSVVTRRTWQRFTFDPGIDESPIWSPDGSHIVWTSYREGAGNLYRKAASGAGPEEALLRSAFRKRAVDWSADG